MKNNIDITYLGDVLDAIKRIEGYLRRVDKEDFQKNLMMQDAVMHQIEIIGEASNNVSEEFQERHLELPWMEMRAIRNKIVHDYREVNLNVIWDTAKNDLPPLKKLIRKLLGE
ncbi:MAG: hypothetical protein COS37_09110 [Anaerolineae bacterium CG03_land_8_20_14_0_80_58_20]|nr:MAG: hypothetical protein AUJ21_01380 [Anaerolineae bacterium CG1_02_58_13]PIV25915.1 MAG: hypothetical protein COS37_09110 [Anaerolineae bacterium CG03_land_8_20_14_0_80_58_20]